MSKQNSDSADSKSLEDGERSVGAIADRCMTDRNIVRRSSCSNMSGTSDRSAGSIMNISPLNALRSTVNSHHKAVNKILLSSKETADRKTTIDTAFRVCKEAFLDLSSACIAMLENKTESSTLSLVDVKSALEDVLSKFCSAVPGLGSTAQDERAPVGVGAHRSYASAVGAAASKVQVARGSSFEIPRTTNFLVVPKDENATNFSTSSDTREALIKAVRPSDFDLKVRKIKPAHGNGNIRIEAHSVDLPKIRNSEDLGKAGLKIEV